MQTSEYIASAAALVSLLALGATLWQGWITRQHGRLSVRPNITVINERLYDGSGARIRLLARSVGLGPAIVTDHYFCKSSARLIFPDQTSVTSTLLKQLIGASLQYRVLHEGHALRQYVLPVGAELVLLDVHFPTLTVQTIGVVDTYMTDISLHLKYESFYGEAFSADINAPNDA